MLYVAKLPEENRRELFRETGFRMQVNEAIIEKDFWVCWVLDYLFNKSQWKDKLIFKGGTSLSKVYGAIQRFSEDVDLVIDWTLLGLTAEEAFVERSNKQQNRFRHEIEEKTTEFLNVDFVPVIQEELSARLGEPVTASLEKQDDQVKVLVEYPRSFSIEYIRPAILLELGPRSLHEPNEVLPIQPYSASHFPAQFQQATIDVRAVAAERTFWEKATILHREANRTPDKKPPKPGLSRHYYDLYRLCYSGTLEKALEKIDLLNSVADFKMRFFKCGWAKYDEAKPGTLELVPPEHSVGVFRKDYDSMQDMLFGEKPTFDQILSRIAEVQAMINQ